MTAGFTIGYINFTIFLLLFTGIIMLRLDVKVYQSVNLMKENKAARILGWLNLILGVVVFMGHWFYNSFLMW
jgi:uncharacterized membrane protein